MNVKNVTFSKSFTKKSFSGGKHSLDSDEEEDVIDEHVLKDDDIEGQEEDTLQYDEGITFTPFNMRDELEDGHFDGDGHYIFKKDKEKSDGWIENIDFVGINQHPKALEAYNRAESEDEDDDEISSIDLIPYYRKMINFMKSGETVLKALRRLGGGKAGIASSSASQRWKAKKMKVEQKAVDVDKEGLLELTGLADKILQNGVFEIYQETYEKVANKIKAEDDKKMITQTSVPEDADEDDVLDMFAESLDKKVGEQIKTNESNLSKEKQSITCQGKEMKSEVMWEYKWKDDKEEELHGPFSSSEMMEWMSEGFFSDGILVRKCSSESQFYDSKRIDFELYV